MKGNDNKDKLYPGADSNCHAILAPPPQDGASTNFATRVKD